MPGLTFGAIGAVTAAVAVGAGGAAAPRPVAQDESYHPTDTFVATPYVVPLDIAVAMRSGRPKVPEATLGLGGLPALLDPSARSIPRTAIAAYVAAAATADLTNAGCNLGWPLLAGIGYVESGHARSGGSASPTWNGEATPPILGPMLDGHGDGIGTIRDTDHGRLDGSSTWDRAVGPMQFIPSTWTRYAADGNHDGVRDPENIWDATLAAAGYLCAASGGLDEPANEAVAVYAYNHSLDYVRAVLAAAAVYEGGTPTPLPLPPPAPSRTLLIAATPAPTPTATPTPSPTGSGTVSPSPTASASYSPPPSPLASRRYLSTPTPSPSAS